MNRIRYSHNGIDEKTYELCEKYYLEYKESIDTPVLNDVIIDNWRQDRDSDENCSLYS